MTRDNHQPQHAQGRDPHTEPAPDENDGGSILGTIGSTLAVIFCLAILAAVGGSVLGHYRLDIVLSGSMKPAYGPGDLIYAVKKPVNQLSAGDVLMFKPPAEYGNTPVTHRVVSARMSPSGVVTVRTKGDNNATVDPWEAEVTTPEVWVVTQSIPKVGYLSQWAKTWWPLLLAVAVAVPMASVARRHTAAPRTPQHTPGAGPAPDDEAPRPDGKRRSTTLLWYVPALVVLSAGIFVTATGAGVVEKVTDDARSWQNDRDAPNKLLLNRFSLAVSTNPVGDGITGSDDRHTRTVDGAVQHALTLRTVPAQYGITLTAAAAKTNKLSGALSVGVTSCTHEWAPTPDGFTCPGKTAVLVGNVPLQGTTITIADPGQRSRSASPHILLELRVPPQAVRSAAGQAALLDVRVDAVRH